MVLVGGLVALAVLLTFVVRTVIGGLPQLGASLTQSIAELTGWLANGPLHISSDQLGAAQQQLFKTLQENQANITAATLTTAATVGELLTEFLLVVFTLIFFLHGGDAIWRFLLKARRRHAPGPGSTSRAAAGSPPSCTTCARRPSSPPSTPS